MVVAAIWHTDCAGSGGGDGYCNRKEGEQPIEELHGQKNYNVPLVAKLTSHNSHLGVIGNTSQRAAELLIGEVHVMYE